MAAETDAAVATDSLNGLNGAAAAAAAAPNTTLRPISQQPPAPPVLPPPLPLITTMPPAVTCTFVGEGSANAVFRLTLIADDDSDSDSTDNNTSLLATSLLRIPKANPGVNPATCLEHHAYYAAVLRPLMGSEWLVGHHLIQGVNTTGVHAALNRLLADLDYNRCRRPDWVGTRVAANVGVALLVEDVSSAAALGTTTIQFKPKWLVQSRTAPVGARRCRTCALSASALAAVAKSIPLPPDGSGANGAKGADSISSKAPYKYKPCPMVLVADPPTTPAAERDQEAALWDYICQHIGGGGSSSVPASPAVSNMSASSYFAPTPSTVPVALLKARPAIIAWLRTTNLFCRVAAIQAEFDPHGALSLSVDTESPDAVSAAAGSPDSIANTIALDRLQTAMTLRDCTCFLRVTVPPSSAPSPSSPSSPPPPASVSAKLGDLDRKDGRRKLASWQKQERALLAGGFYLGTEEPRQQTRCWLERQWA